MRIALLIPEFPGQTHDFIWRERGALLQLGIESVLISTRPPPPAIMAHDWAANAAQRTSYLAPRDMREAASMVLRVFGLAPARITRCIQQALQEEGSLAERLALLTYVPVAARLGTLARASGARHVHVHSCGNAALIASFAHILMGLQYSLTLHGPSIGTYGRHQALKWRNAAFGLAVSRGLRKAARATLGVAAPRVLLAAPMGVDLQRLRRGAEYRPWAGGECRIVSCGRLNPIKGHERLIEAAAELVRRGIDIRVSIAGEDEEGGCGYRRAVEIAIERLGMASRVQLLGAVSQEHIRALLESAHVFALASYDEGVPVAVMEAMAMETPTIATDVGGTSELLTPGAGILLEDGRPSSLAGAIESILRDPARAIALSRAGRARVASKFSHDRRARILARLLRQADCERGSLPPRGVRPEWSARSRT